MIRLAKDLKDSMNGALVSLMVDVHDNLHQIKGTWSHIFVKVISSHQYAIQPNDNVYGTSSATTQIQHNCHAI